MTVPPPESGQTAGEPGGGDSTSEQGVPASGGLGKFKNQIEFILGATKTGLDIIDAGYNIRYIDPAWEKVYGDSKGKKCFEYFMGRSEACPGCGVTQALKTKTVVVTQEVLVKEGNRVIQVTSIPFKDDSGEWLVAEVNVDITDRTKMEAELQRIQSQQKAILDNNPDIAWLKDRDSRFIAVNEQFGRLCGLRPAEVVGKSDFDIWPEDLAERYRADDLEVMQTGRRKVVEGPLADRGGKIQWIETITTPIYDSNGHVVGTTGIARDITARKRMEEELEKTVAVRTAELSRANIKLKAEIAERRRVEEVLRESEDKYRTLVERANDGIAIVQNSRLAFTNRRFAQMTGYAAEELTGKSFTDIIAPSELLKMMDHHRRRIEGEDVESLYETTIRHRDGTDIPVEFNASLITYNGRPASIILVRDITERKKAEEALRASENLLKSQFENSPDMILTISPELKILTMNHTPGKRVTLEDAIGSDALSHIPPSEKESIREKLMECLKTGEKTEFEHTILGGAQINARIVPLKKDSVVERLMIISTDITQRKKAEDALRESEERYRKLVENAPEGIAVHSGGKLVYVNQAAADIVGFKDPQSLVGEDVLRLVHPSSRPVARERIRTMMEEGVVVPPVEEKFLRADGSEVDVNVVAMPMTFSGERSVLVIFSDVTEKKRAREEIQSLADKFTKIFQSSPALMGITALNDGRFIEVNEAFLVVTGFTRETVIGRTPMELGILSRETRHKITKMLRRDGRIRNYEVEMNLQGQPHIGLFSAELMDVKGEKCVLAVVSDITGLKRAEREILDIKTHLEAVLDGISESIVVLDRSYHVVSYNKAFQQWVGKSNGYCKGAKCFGVIHGYRKPCRYCVVRQVFRTGKPSESVHCHQTESGLVYHETRAYPIIREGKLLEAIYIFRDVTEREQMKKQLKDNYEQIVKANEELLKLDKMKTEFLSIASHELRTPLAIIKGYADILISSDLSGLSHEQHKQLVRIENNAEHLNVLVDNILDLTRIDAGELKLTKTRFSISKLAFEVLDDMAQLALKKGVRLKLKSRDKTRILADRGRIKQVLNNLVDNSIKFTPLGGEVTVIISKKKSNIRIIVSDTGIGIPAKELPNVFKTFYQADSSTQRKYKGAGLGLTICERILRLHGGNIKIRSVYRGGTTVTLTIPLSSNDR